MKKTITISLITLVILTLCGCGEPQRYDEFGMDWQAFNEQTEDAHVYYAQSTTNCFSDGSFESDLAFTMWERAKE